MKGFQFINNMKIRSRILATIFILALTMTGIGIYEMVELGKSNERSEAMFNENLRGIARIGGATESYLKYRIRVLMLLAYSDPAKQRQIREALPQLENELLADVAKYGEVVNNEEDRQRFEALTPAWQNYKKSFELFLTELDKGTPESKDAALRIAENEGAQAGAVMEKLFAELVTHNEEAAKAAQEAGATAYNNARIMTIAVIVIGVVASAIFGYMLAQSISVPLQNVERVAAAVAEGDLTSNVERLEGDNEIASLSRSIDNMVTNLRSLILQVAEGSTQVAAASQQISASTEQMALGSQNQANEAQSLTLIIQQMSDAVDQVAASAQSASVNSEKVSTSTENGQIIIDKSVKGMQTINEKVDILGKSSEQIGEIIEVIDDIAGQTNLLALNAAIEAARAGEHGKGFAVVAEEVRKLAERSSQATKEIGNLIKGIQRGTEDAVEAVSIGSQLAIEAGESFKEIARLVKDTAAQIAEIAAAAEEQAASADNSVHSVQNIAAITEESTTAAEETANSANTLAKMAVELQQAVAKFRIS